MKKTTFLLLVFALMVAVQTASALDALAAYRSNTGSCTSNALNCPKIRTWSSVSNIWGSEVELATAGSPVSNLVVKVSPFLNKTVLVTQSIDGNLDAYVCTTNCA